jgi:hypothetical protein
MAVVLVLSVMGTALIQIQAARTRRQTTAIDNVRALYVAEAGLAEAFFAVAEGKSGMVGAEAEPASFGDGVYWVEAARSEQGEVVLVSNALCGTGRFSLAMVLQPRTNPIGALGFFGIEEVRVGTGAILDGFDSRTGSFDEQVEGMLPGETTGFGARIASNGPITIDCTQPLVDERTTTRTTETSQESQTSTIVYGDVTPGPSDTAVLAPGAVVSGSTAPAIAKCGVPPIEVPDLEPAGRAPRGTLTGAASYESLRVAAGSSLTIVGPATVSVGVLTVETGATLTFDTSQGEILLYCTEQLALEEGSVLATTVQDTQSCAILVSAPDGVDHDGDGAADPAITLGATGVLCGVLYAPVAQVTVPAALRVFGSIAAERLVLEDGARLSFDQSLAVEGGGVASVPKFISWHVVSLPDSPLVELRADPLLMLAVNGATTTPSARAHIERTFTLQYMNDSGVVTTYTGAPQNLDWSRVRHVLGTIWYDKNGRVVNTYEWQRTTIAGNVQTTYDGDEVSGTDLGSFFQLVPISKTRL